jgi:stearoyl-CoA desaturase (delta-9 desaturase)
MLDGLLALPWWGYVLVTLALTHLTIITVTVFLHRSQAHRAVDLHPVVSHFLRFWNWLTTGMVTKEWVAVHRKHHAKCETPEDPHSPHVEGIWTVLWQGAELYRREVQNPETAANYGHGTPDDWIERRVYSKLPFLGVTLMAIIDLTLFGAIGLTVWAVQMMWIPFFAAGVVNGMGHYWGYRNFDTTDGATNLINIGILIGGEELHNNHHAFPSSAKFSFKPWEFDIGWLYIRVLQAVGLAKVKKVAPKPMIVDGKDVIDMDTLKAVFASRLHVMSQYARRVALPVLQSAQQKATSPSDRALFKQLGKAFSRNRHGLAAAAKPDLAAAVASDQSLAVVYEFGQELQDMWQRTYSSHEKLLQALQDWCSQAEATGVKYLEDFAQSLRGYSLRMA